MPEQPDRVILASGSQARQRMLRAAGVAFEVVPADVDEPFLRDGLLSGSPMPVPSAAIAEVLAAAKAREVSRRFPGALVIGSDQTLDAGGDLLSKPGDDAGVRETLRILSGRAHTLHSAVALAVRDSVIWSARESATLTMRPLSAAFIETYVRDAGEGVRHCVGAYEIEGLGSQLFERIDGDHFTILGMPLLPLLQALRQQGVLSQ